MTSLLAVFALCAAAAAFAPNTTKPMDLSGSWRFQLDRKDEGVQNRWFEKALPDKIRLPGSLPEQGIGDPISVDTPWTGDIYDRSWFTAPQYARYRQSGHVKIPFWLQPETYYKGAAWFQRDIEVPAEWSGRRIVLSFERPHWETRVWIDGHAFGAQNSLGTPHEYVLGSLEPGHHVLSLRVDNRMIVNVGQNAHSVSDHTQGNWNGVVGKILLRSTAPVWLDELKVYPKLSDHAVLITGHIGNFGKELGRGKILLSLRLKGGSKVEEQGLDAHWRAQSGTFYCQMPVENMKLWDEFTPSLYELTATLDGTETCSTTFGMREISTQGNQLLLNGHKAFLRGTLECAIFPKTGHPPTDVASWKRLIRIAKAHGLNHIRFHSWCPPEAAFIAADELGFYYQVEVSSWSAPGDDKALGEWLYQEADRMLRDYGNHPSFMFMPYGNEPGGDHQNEYLAKWVAHYKQQDSRRLFTSASGWPQLEENQYHVTPDPRIQHWGGEGLNSRINASPPETRTDYREYISARRVPVVSHEIGQWCVYPDFDEIPKYTGYLKPHNFEIFRDTLNMHHMSDQARQFLLASGKLQTLCYKEDIESALRTPGMGGFQLLDLHDFPGQGTALVGVLNPFWESKGYVTPKEYHRFCGPVVPLSRLEKRVFTTAETLSADIEIANFGSSALPNAEPYWRLVTNGRTVASGHLPSQVVAIGNGIELGNVRIDLAQVTAPAQYKLVVGLSGTDAENDWDVWVYPDAVSLNVPAGIEQTDSVDKAIEAATKGAKVLLLLKPDRVRREGDRPVVMGFSSIFWNTAYTNRQPPTTLGVLVDPKHPLFAEFPTDFHSDWQWWYLIKEAAPMNLDSFQPEMRPTVQIIDDWTTAHRLGLVLEGKLGKGQIVICSIDLDREPASNPVARQFHHSLLDYMSSPRFSPAHALTEAEIRTLVK